VTESRACLREVRESDRGVILVIACGGELETHELARDAVPAGLPAAGGSIDSPLLAEIRMAAERKRAARRVFTLLDRRLRSRADLERRLREDGFAPAVAAAVLDSFAAADLHSDHRFATAFCRDSLSRKAVGRRWLWAKLRERGVDATVADEVVAAELPADRERELALAAAALRWRREKGPRDRRAEARVARFLAGRGFPAPLCREAMRETKRGGEASDQDGPPVGGDRSDQD